VPLLFSFFFFFLSFPFLFLFLFSSLLSLKECWLPASNVIDIRVNLGRRIEKKEGEGKMGVEVEHAIGKKKKKYCAM